MRETRFLLILAVVALLSVPLAVAQDGYGDKIPEVQTRNLPAGVVNDPGSELIFLLDTGLNAESLYKCDPAEDDDCNYTSWSVSDYDAANDGALFQNFLSITNTNPTDSVTVHFRFINRDCSDVLDFLVVLSCNDTMLIDPFNERLRPALWTAISFDSDKRLKRPLDSSKATEIDARSAKLNDPFPLTILPTSCLGARSFTSLNHIVSDRGVINWLVRRISRNRLLARDGRPVTV